MQLKSILMALRFIVFGKLFSSILQSLGTLWVVVESFAFFFDDTKWPQEIKERWYLFLAAGVIIGLWRGKPKLSQTARIKETDVKVVVKVGDIFSSSDCIVVGSNTTFDAKLSDGTISPRSVQGQFTNKYFPSEAHIENLIQNALAGRPLKRLKTRVEKPFGLLAEYEMGTTIRIVANDRAGYFASIAALNEHRVAGAEQNDFLDALPRMWSEIRQRGEFEPLCCPVLGSSFARLNLTREQLIIEMIKSFVAATIEANFSESLTIFVSYDDFGKGLIDLSKISNALEHECNFAISNSRSEVQDQIGVPVGDDEPHNT